MGCESPGETGGVTRQKGLQYESCSSVGSSSDLGAVQARLQD
jgi:hypothetical protein